MNLNLLHKKICSCRLCDLCLSRNKAVPGEGPTPAEIMLIGEAPGAEEDLIGRPFVGMAGRLLDKALVAANIVRSELFVTSVVKCRPPRNRKPRQEEIVACHPYLKIQMEIANPRIVCLMGNVACQAILHKQGIASLHGQVFQDNFLVTYHPAAILRNKNLMEAFVIDLKKLNKL